MISHQRTLLERLFKPSSKGSLDDVGILVESIRSNLERMLNSVQGTALAMPDYGMPPLSEFDYDSESATRKFTKAVEKLIQRYEPRLDGVKVVRAPSNSDSSALTPQFEIVAVLATAERHPVRLQASNLDGRRVKITL